jgi:hypothetical protein
MNGATHQIVAGPYAGRDCWVDREYPGAEWAIVNMMPMKPWVFPETACVRTAHLRKITAYEKAKQYGEALF